MGTALITQKQNQTLHRKAGFGIVEVLISAVILGFLLIALLNLQGGNRDSLLRVRARDGAVVVAQEVIDSLSALGLASLSDAALAVDPNIDANDANLLHIPNYERTWKGQPGVVSHDVKVEYKVQVQVSEDDDYKAKEESAYNSGEEHVYAKRLDVTVSWNFKGSTQSINMSGVVR